MSPDGTTNQTIGLAWAWMSLTGGGPFTVPAKDPNYKYRTGHHSDERRPEHREPLVQQRSSIDARRARMTSCTNARRPGITLYTIHVNTDGDPTSQVLKNCASDTNKFFTVTSSGQIGTVFTRSEPTCRSCASRSNSG